METLKSTVRRIVTAKPSGWAVIKVGLGDDEATVVGMVGHLRPGESVELTGFWEKGGKFGRQFKAQGVEVTVPATIAGISAYLETIDGIGPAMASLLVQAFGESTLDVIREEPARLFEVDGIGRVRAETIAAAVGRDGVRAEAMVRLRQWHVPPSVIPMVIREWGHETIERVQADPYSLISEFSGVGFKTADAVATSIGFPITSPARIDAGVIHELREAVTRLGHTYSPRQSIIRDSCRLLALREDSVIERLAALEEVGRVAIDGDAVYLTKMFELERSLAAEIIRMMAAPAKRPPGAVEPADLEGLKLSDRQAFAVAEALRRKIAIINGGPGTGKTTVTKMIVRAAERLGWELMLCAPTGKASRRMADVTGAFTSTIHRALGSAWGRDFKFFADLIIVDESSMLDVEIAERFFRCVADGARLVLVGDVDQLPSVGPGRVLGDMITSGRVPVVTLDQPFRQAVASKIIVAAHQINAGIVPEVPKEVIDFTIIERKDHATIAHLAVQIAARLLPGKYGFENVMILSPMRKGDIGVDALNVAMQAELNPNGSPFGKAGFRVGDRVMVVSNDYDLDVFNGDTGVVRSAVDDVATLRLDDGRDVVFAPRHHSLLRLAYACTVHKMQGSEVEAVVVIAHSSHTHMLSRSLLYTAVTRSRRYVAILGELKALERAVGKVEAGSRHSGLSWRIAETGPPPPSTSPPPEPPGFFNDGPIDDDIPF